MAFQVVSGLDDRFKTGQAELLGPDQVRFGSQIGRPDLPAGTEFQSDGIVYRVEDTGRGTRRLSQRGSVSDVEAQQAQQARENQMRQMFQGFRTEEQELLDRFGGFVEGLEPLRDIRARIGEELGLPTLRSAAQTLRETISTAPTQIRQRLAQLGVSAPAAQSRIERVLGEVAPQFEVAEGRLGSAEKQLLAEMGLEQQQQERQFLPFEKEFDFLSERIARETTGFTNIMKNELDILLQKLRNEGSLRVEELRAANELALMEEKYNQELEQLKFGREIITAGGRKLLIDTLTGEVIVDFGPSTSGGGGGGISDEEAENAGRSLLTA